MTATDPGRHVANSFPTLSTTTQRVLKRCRINRPRQRCPTRYRHTKGWDGQRLDTEIGELRPALPCGKNNLSPPTPNTRRGRGSQPSGRRLNASRGEAASLDELERGRVELSRGRLRWPQVTAATMDVRRHRAPCASHRARARTFISGRPAGITRRRYRRGLAEESVCRRVL
jgi:hypothetical protein